MTTKSPTPALEFLAIILFLWLSIAPVLASSLSLFGALPTQIPGLAFFASSPLEWRLVFFLAGCVALVAAWLVYKRFYRHALAAAVIFAALYLPAFYFVWGQRNLGMVLAVVSVAIVGVLAFARRRDVG